MDEKYIGGTKIAKRWRISLISDVRDILEEQGYDVEEGDKMVYWLKDGDIVIRPGNKP